MIGVFASCYYCIFTGTWHLPNSIMNNYGKLLQVFFYGDTTYCEVGFFGWLGQVLSHSTTEPYNFWSGLNSYLTYLGLTGSNAVYALISALMALVSTVGVIIIMYKLLKWAITSWVYKFR